VRLSGFVNCTPDFLEQPKVVNGASDLMVEVFGERGQHARTAIGSVALPLDSAVEVEAIFQLKA
jgi:enamine deaminase RidA (YjgF/YER057c/UK114 family)